MLIFPVNTSENLSFYDNFMGKIDVNLNIVQFEHRCLGSWINLFRWCIMSSSYKYFRLKLQSWDGFWRCIELFSGQVKLNNKNINGLLLIGRSSYTVSFKTSILNRGHSFITLANFSEKVKFLTPWYAQVRLCIRG